MAGAAFWDVTHRCNLRCAHCAVADLYYRQPNGTDLALEEGLIILRRLYEAGYHELQLLGGEPLLRRDIADLVAAANKIGFTRVMLVTNGTCLTPALADMWLDAGLHELIVSLEGATAYVHEQVRGPGTFAQAMRGLENMLQQRPKGHPLKIVAQLTLSRPNLHEAAQWVDLVGAMGLDVLSIGNLYIMGNACQNMERLAPTLVETLDAREAALQAATRYPNLTLRVFGNPRTKEYFNARFGLNLPIILPSCDMASGQRVIVRADASIPTCDVAQAEDFAAWLDPAPATPAETPRLLEQPLADILASAHFEPLKRIVNRVIEERWQDEFAPCARCHHRPACQLCPLFLRQQKDKLATECLLAVQRHAQWRKSQRAGDGPQPVAATAEKSAHA